MVAGLGDPEARVRVYVAKAPPLSEYQQLSVVQPLQTGEIAAINSACGNGWRKVFNVYAKLLYALPAPWRPQPAPERWQYYRDSRLLQAGSGTALLFSPPTAKPGLHIIAGRQHARALAAADQLPARLSWLDCAFAVADQGTLLVCPYLDYRQLSDRQILRVSTLVAQLP